MAQRIIPRTLNRKVPSSNLLAAAVVSIGNALCPHCLVPRKGLKAIGSLVACLSASCFLNSQLKSIQRNQTSDSKPRPEVTFHGGCALERDNVLNVESPSPYWERTKIHRFISCLTSCKLAFYKVDRCDKSQS